MYGLILENLSQYIISVHGEDKWLEIRMAAKVANTNFSTHQVYPDNLIPRVISRACKILKMSQRELLVQMGVHFVSFVSQYGYDRVLGVLGRHMRDFLNGLDNLHEYLKFSYPRMIAPSFFCENESRTGLTLHYRSTRKGFLWYAVGQIKEVGRHFYKTEVEIEVIKEETILDTLHVIMNLTFDNKAFITPEENIQIAKKVEKVMMPVKAFLFLDIFPFCIVFDDHLVIRTIGNSLQAVMPKIVGKKLSTVFDLVKPLIECTWRAIQSHTNNIFELNSVDPVKAIEENVETSSLKSYDSTLNDEMIHMEDRLLHLKGQMMYMEEWKSIVYLGTPVLRDLDAMVHTGLYINDLSMHDFSRDMVLAGQQQSAEMKLALDQELQKSKQLEESMKRLDLEMRRTDELLYQMIPKQVADRLRKGEAAVETCQLFDSVTILFSDVVTFTEICSRITPMEVVSMLNSMYSLFDQLTEKHHVYKVETIGDAYMVVAGAPDADAKHAYRICLMALDMVTVITDLKDPSTGDSLRIRVGVHTGAVVAGVVGLKMPRYCLFGDAVNTASRMESTSEALKIHISEKTRDMLDLSEWDISDRGTVTVKGKGEMKTYWLHGRTKPPHTPFPMTPIVIEPTTVSRKPMTPAELMDSADTRSLYSPVTFEDVSRYTPIPSPVGSAFSEGIPEMDTLKLQEPSVSSRIATQRKGSSRIRSNAVPMDLVQAESRNAEIPMDLLQAESRNAKVPMDLLQAESRNAEVPMDRLQAESRNAKIPMDLVQAESKPVETVNSTAVQTSPDPPVCSFGFFAAPTAKSLNFTNAMEPPSIRHETNGFLAVKHIHSCYHQWNTPQLTPAYTTSETSRMQQQPVHDFSRKSIKKGNVRLIQVAPKVKDMPDRNDIQRGRPLTKSNTCALL